MLAVLAASVTLPMLLPPAGMAPLMEIEPRLIGCVACQNVPVTARLALATVTDPMLLTPAGIAPLMEIEPKLIG
jgi:hypothetical protein